MEVHACKNPSFTGASRCFPHMLGGYPRSSRYISNIHPDQCFRNRIGSRIRDMRLSISVPTSFGLLKDSLWLAGVRGLTITTNALRLTDTIADMLGFLRRPIEPDSLIGIARRQTGLTDFGDSSFVGPLARLLHALSTESQLSVVGRSATRWDVIRFLSNLLLIQDSFTRLPGIAAEQIRQPIFITGLPRSGTTFLHRLMLTDPANRAPAVWETIFPSPTAGTREQRIARVDKQLKAFSWLAPEFPSLHPMNATSPQECSEITAHVFRSLRFDTTYHIPSYRAWLDADVAHHLPAYRFHKRFLQFLQHHDGKESRWVLKCPEHLFALPVIRAVYPDARLVFVHRDPLKVLLSQAQLTEVLRRPFTRHVDALSLGPLETRRWLSGAQRMIDAGESAGFSESICHVHHMDLISDPVSTVEGVYRHFSLPFESTTAAAIESFVAAKPKGGYGEHHYTFESHSLDEARERAQFRPYMVHFGIAAETTSARGDAGMPVPNAGALS
ncbi:MAG TPA: sulfotransferase [Rhodopila sp.]|nr:sulfotransferase [Rhodopila sp.]